jgi:hypothetical protein
VKNHSQPDTLDWAQKFRTDLRALLLKNLDASPLFRRICRQALGLDSLNSNQLKNLAERQLHFSRSRSMPYNKPKASQPEAAKPPAFKNVRTCQHIKVTGVPCGGPPMRGEQFCYFHQRMLRGVKTPPSARLHPIALIEDEESIQVSLMEIINALARNHIDLPRAALIIRALNIAVKNARRARPNAYGHQMVREIPDYPAPPKPATSPARAFEESFAEEDRELKERAAKNALAQLQARALATIPTPAKTTAAPTPVLVPAAAATTKIQTNQHTSTQPVTPLDPAHRKLPASTGIPFTTKPAVNQGKTRT